MKFSQRFTNIDINIDEARKRFANRMLYVLFPRYPIPYGRELQLVSRALGEMITKIQQVEDIIHNDFYRILDMLERLVNILHENATNIASLYRLWYFIPILFQRIIKKLRLFPRKGGRHDGLSQIISGRDSIAGPSAY